MFKVEYYQKPDKTKPVDVFINSLNDKLKAKTLRDLKLLQEFGNELREPLISRLLQNLFCEKANY